MAVYYKFKSAKDFDSIPIDGHFISVANLKERIFEVKHLGRGTDFDLMVSNAQTNEEYADEAMLIPKNTSVLIRRVPGRPRKPIVAAQEVLKVEAVMLDHVPAKSDVPIVETSAMRIVEEPEWDEFGNDLYDIPEAVPVQSAVPIVNTFAPSMVDEESKIKAFVDTNALDWQRQIQENAAAGRGFGRGMGGRMMGGRGIGRGMGGGVGGGMMRKTPPQGYVCHRCNIPGHFIQHCPTNGDPNFDIKRVKPPTGIPKSMLMATPDGSYALPSGAVAVMKPNEAAFEREIEGLPSARPVTEFPPELRCPLCSNVMKDAVLTSKCCFSSFCDKCIRDYIISKGMCVCGATHILADDLVPNKTVRVTISHILESTTSSADNAGSMQQIQDMESARLGVLKAPSPTQSATSKEGSKGILLGKEEEDNGGAAEARVAEPPPETRETSQESGEKAVSSDPGKKKKKKKARLPGAGEMQPWPRGYPEMESYPGMMPIGGPFNPVFPGVMPWGMDGFLGPMPGHSLMGFPPHGPLDMPPYPYAPGLLMPPPLLPLQQPLDMPEMGGPNRPMPRMGRSEAEKQKGEMRRGRESEQRPERGHSRDRDRDRDSSLSRSRHRTEDQGERFTWSVSSHGPSSDWAEQARSRRTEKDEKSSRGGGSDRPEKSSRTGGSDRPEKRSGTSGSDRAEKSSRTSAERPEKSSRIRSDRPEKSSRTSAERPEKSRRTSSDLPEKSSRTSAERPEKSRRTSSDLPEKSSQMSGSDRPEKKSRTGVSDRPEKKSRTSGSDRPEKSGGTGSLDQPEKSGGTGSSDRPEKNSHASGLDRPEKSSGTRDSDRSEKSGGTSGSDRPEKSSRTRGSDRSERSSRSSRSDREKSSRTNGLDQEKAEEAEVLPPPPPLPATMAPPSGDRKQKGSVFSRISFPESGKKRIAEEKPERNKSAKGSSSSSAGGSARHAGASEERESDDDYHFKRRPAATRGENEKENDVHKGSSKSSAGDRDRRSKRR